VLHFQTPYQLLFNSKPSYDYFRAFGCLCYISTLKQGRTKFDPRAQPCVFLGYPTAKKAYKVYNLVTKKIHFSRDMVFHEHYFPFQHESVLPNHIFLPTKAFDHSFSYDTTPVFESSTSDLTSQHPLLSPSSSPLSSSPTNIFSQPAPHSISPTIPLPPCKSTRISTPPSYLKDFVCSSSRASHFSSSHWCNLVQFSASSPDQQQHILHLDHLHEPSSYKEAAISPHWVKAMPAELDALKANQTWTEVDLPPGKKAISSKWVYKVKLKVDGSLKRYKAQLVIRGNTQKEGIDYTETFFPVVKMTTIKTIIALVASRQWSLFQLDVNNAFLHGDSHEEVYMKMPEGIPNPSNKVCRLQKSLYGLKQASRQWHAKLVDFLKLQGYTQSKNDYSLFLKSSDTDVTIVAMYVDDILLTGSNLADIQALK